MLLTILIPTYNRRQYLEKNCQIIVEAIKKLSLTNVVKLLISNNSSSDNTKEYLTTVIQQSDVNIEVVNQEENIGSVNNVLYLLKHSTTPYIMYLGDDDYLTDDYLAEVVKLISDQSQNICSIIPSNLAISEEGKPLGYSRDIDLPTKVFEAGFNSCRVNSWRGHQMSGLVLKTEGLNNLCEKHKITNMYLFIYLVAECALSGSLVHLTDYPIKVSSPTQAAKGWSYGDDGLISHIFDNYKKLENITQKERMLLELKILDEQYWRYIMYIKKGPFAFFKALKQIIFGENTSKLTRYMFPLLLPYFLIKRVILLIMKGELQKTLKKPVDI